MLGRILRDLSPFSPTLIGTFPLGLQIDGSDIDIACTCADLGAFERALASLGFTSIERLALAPQAVVASLACDDAAVEVFCQPLPVHAQAGFRHMIVEGRLLVLGGSALADRVRDAKRSGLKTEAAFAAVLGLDGDPFEAVLALERWSDDRLRALVDGALPAARLR